MPYRVMLPLALTVIVAVAMACTSETESPVSRTASPSASPSRVSTRPTASATASPVAEACPSPSGTAPKATVKSYSARPDLTIDTAKKYSAVVKTVRGDFTIELRPDLAPETVNSFIFLARDHFFDGIIFHRVEPGFVVQGGDPTGTGRGGPGYSIPLEPSAEPFVRGVLGMARSSDPNSGGSQWFVTLGDALFLNDVNMPLDKRYTVFGKVTQGMEVVDCIAVGDAIVGIDIQEG